MDTNENELAPYEAVRQALEAATRKEPQAAQELLPLVYEELRRIAGSRLMPGQTLQATALVHEAWLEVVGERDPGWDGRAHFFAAAAQAMREVLIDQARRRSALKRGGDRKREPLDPQMELKSELPFEDLLALDEALDELRKRDPGLERVVALRFFAGLTMSEVAETLGISMWQVEERWRFARAWLRRRLESNEAEA